MRPIKDRNTVTVCRIWCTDSVPLWPLLPLKMTHWQFLKRQFPKQHDLTDTVYHTDKVLRHFPSKTRSQTDSISLENFSSNIIPARHDPTQTVSYSTISYQDTMPHELPKYLDKGRNFRGKKTSRISRILAKFAKINSFFDPRKCRFAKINSREICQNWWFAKINSRKICCL